MKPKKYQSTEVQMWKTVKANPNMAVPWYLMSAYAYYERDSPFLPDADFDALAKFMLEHWTTIEHRHKHLITEDDLKAGTLLNRNFPSIVQDAASIFIK